MLPFHFEEAPPSQTNWRIVSSEVQRYAHVNVQRKKYSTVRMKLTYLHVQPWIIPWIWSNHFGRLVHNVTLHRTCTHNTYPSPTPNPLSRPLNSMSLGLLLSFFSCFTAPLLASSAWNWHRMSSALLFFSRLSPHNPTGKHWRLTTEPSQGSPRLFQLGAHSLKLVIEVISLPRIEPFSKLAQCVVYST